MRQFSIESCPYREKILPSGFFREGPHSVKARVRMEGDPVLLPWEASGVPKHDLVVPCLDAAAGLAVLGVRISANGIGLKGAYWGDLLVYATPRDYLVQARSMGAHFDPWFFVKVGKDALPSGVLSFPDTLRRELS